MVKTDSFLHKITGFMFMAFLLLTMPCTAFAQATSTPKLEDYDRIQFSKTDHAEERAIALKYLSEPEITTHECWIGLADLNNDGVQDILALLVDSYWCGTSGCVLHFLIMGENKKPLPGSFSERIYEGDGGGYDLDGFYISKTTVKGNRVLLKKSFEGLREYYTGKWNGQGTETDSDGGNYVGKLKNGRRNGRGTLTRSDGTQYVGEFEDGHFQGQGILTRPDGTKYSGQFFYEDFPFRGTLTKPDGTQYTGQFKDGHFHGHGTLTKPDGIQYKGQFEDDRFHGQGTLTKPDGTVNKGIWNCNRLIPETDKCISGNCVNGYGTYIDSNGEKYVGEFKDNNKSGQGTETVPCGGKYVGSWEYGARHGQGTLTETDGTKYVGEWHYACFHGKGTLTSPDGTQYVGQFSMGEFWGQGTLTLPDGTVKKGYWEDGTLLK